MYSLSWLFANRANAMWLFKLCCGVHVFHEYIATLTQCVGPSMMPTVNPSGDVILTESISPRMRWLQRGDVIVARSPRDPNMSVCKRIVALEGDRVCVNPGKLNPEFKTVPRNHVWLQGDNLSNSIDSRTYGAVPYAMITGRAVAKVWPPSHVGRMRREDKAKLEPVALPEPSFSEPQATQSPQSSSAAVSNA